MSKYDFFIAGRWRNRETVKEVLDIIRSNGFSAYSFIENLYEGEKVEFSITDDIEKIMQKLEALPQDDPFIKKVFNIDITAENNSNNFLLVLPAGISGHIEAGVAFGMGKKCYAVGKLEKTETLYNIFDEIFSDINSFKKWLNNLK